MSIKRNLDETSIVNYKSNRQFLYAVRKNRIQKIKEPIRLSANCKVIFSATTVLQSEAEKKRRDFFARQGTAKRRPADVLAYVEEAARSRDAA